MSGALEHAARLKPEIRLAQAVSHFEADLSNEQKTAFRTLKSRSIDSPPASSDVMRLTAEIDRRVSCNVGSRCFGPRFTNFLQGVQQFAALGDVVVGGSQCIIACSVWALVRMSLLAIINVSSYVEKFSALFMDMGRSAPRYQAMAILYPRSKSLQSHISEYFIVVVRLCHQLLKFTRKSTFRQVTSTLSDIEINSFRSELDVWANSIKEEVSLLVAKKIDEEAQENSRFRALSKKFSNSMSHQQKLTARLRVLDFCSTHDHGTIWKQTRKIGHATLFNQFPEYQAWKDGAESCTLLYKGKLGSGKSVLLANIVDDLNMRIEDKDTTVAYFFCRHDMPESLKARTVLGSLVRQLLQPLEDFARVADVCDKLESPESTDKVLELLQNALPLSHKVYFVLDGIDECNYLEREVVAQGLQKLRETLELMLCISYREEPNKSLDLITDRFAATRIALIPDDNPDIEAFIQAELERCLECRKLILGEPTLILDIQDALLKGSQGMFLWVALQIQSLCGMETDEAIRSALADLPKDLSETFSRILRKSGEPGQSYQTQILQLILVACQPLTADELREALSVVPGDTAWNPSRHSNDIYSALTCCGSLLVIDEEESTVRFVHHSVKQFVLEGLDEVNNTAFTSAEAQRRMADIIVTYLNYGVFGTEISTTRVSPVIIHSAPSSVIRATLESSRTANSFALKLLKSRKQPSFDISKTLAAARNNVHSPPEEKFYFYSYAKTFWFHHVFYVSGQNRSMLQLSYKSIAKEESGAKMMAQHQWKHLAWAAENGNEPIARRLIISGNIKTNSQENGRTLLLWVAREGLAALMKLLLETDRFDMEFNRKYEDMETPLMLAAKEGHEAVVKMLLETGKLDLDSSDGSGWQKSLLFAAKNGHEAIVRLILDTDCAAADSMDVWGHVSLWYAAKLGHEGVAKLLLERLRLDVNYQNDSSQQTCLWIASNNGHEAVVELLLRTNNIDVNRQDTNGMTPLSCATQHGFTAIVRLLLDTGKVNADMKDRENISLLSFAAVKGFTEIVQLLLKSGKVDVNSQDKNGWTPMIHAIVHGSTAIAKLLLDTGKVDAKSRCQNGRTLLSFTAQSGNTTILKLLLGIDKVDSDLQDKNGMTPLSYAAAKGNTNIVQLLLGTEKVDPDRQDKNGTTSLLYAAAKGNADIVQLLLGTSKVNTDSRNMMGLTPLLCAVLKGNATIVEQLLGLGNANADLADKNGRIPLSFAAERGHVGISKMLLRMGKVNPDSDDSEKKTPLSYAARDGREEVVKLLLDTGLVDPDSCDLEKKTPLSYAAREGREEVIKLLLDTDKVDPDSRDIDGKTPLWFALENWREAAVKLLLDTGRVTVDIDTARERATGTWPIADLLRHHHFVA